MDRWTMDELERTDDLTFAICILDERRSRLNRYSPLSMKIQAAQQTIRRIKEAQDRFIQEICPLTDKEIGEAMDKAADIVNALDEAEEGTAEPCVPCHPTQPECGECEFAEEAAK